MDNLPFIDSLSDTLSKYRDALYYTEILWPSSGRMKRVHYSKSDIESLLAKKGNIFLCFMISTVCATAFCTDFIYTRMNRKWTYKERLNLLGKCLMKKHPSRGSFGCGDCKGDQAILLTFRDWETKRPKILRNMQKKFGFFYTSSTRTPLCGYNELIFHALSRKCWNCSSLIWNACDSFGV